jgi:hypothetical protein
MMVRVASYRFHMWWYPALCIKNQPSFGYEARILPGANT